MSGRWLRKADPQPEHVCDTPSEDESESSDVWACECGRVYLFRDRGYGFGWGQVWMLRKWWYELRFGMTEGDDR